MRKRCSAYRTWGKGYFQLASDGWQEGLLFNRKEHYAYALATLGLMSLLFSLKIYAYALMPNHIHLVLSGTGDDCVDAFYFFRKRTSARLVKDGDPPLPRGYGFKLVPIHNEQEMRNHLLYVLRNPYEKMWCSPLGYLWSSGWLLYSQVGALIKGQKAENLSGRRIQSLLGSKTGIPGNWEFHPEIGLLPRSFVNTKLFYKLFPDVKQLGTSLIKDYEVFSQIARDLDETLSVSEEECRDIVSQLLAKHFGNRALPQLTREEKCLLAAEMHRQYQIPVPGISRALSMGEKTVYQILRSKEYGPRPIFSH